jgi:hypothetical protein
MDGLERLGGYLADAVAALVTAEACAVYLAALGALFLFSGAGKLRRPWLAAMAIVDFGATRAPRPGLGRALGASECLLGAGLLVAPSLGAAPVVLAAGAACLLLAVFALAIGRALRSGREFACMCFGDSEAAISTRTLARTTLLAAVAGLVAIATAVESPSYATADHLLAVIAGTAAVAALAVGAQARRMWHLPEPPPGLMHASEASS